MADRLLLADVGGTHTRVGLADVSGVLTKTVQTLRNTDYCGLAPLLASYLSIQNSGPVSALCAGVAGPVRNGIARLTNLDWVINSTELQTATGAPSVHLINDLQAQGYALDDLAPASVTQLFPGGQAHCNATRLVIGLGTGCNVAVVHRTPAGLLVPPAENGHASLPCADAHTNALIEHLAQTHPHKPIEAALSGPGLARIHAWLSGVTLPPDQIISMVSKGETNAIETLTLFTRLLGAVAGNLALAHLPMGGVFFIGGTARGVAPYLADLGFLDSFTFKGPYQPILRDIPVFLITDDTAALKGCARYLRQIAVIKQA